MLEYARIQQTPFTSTVPRQGLQHHPRPSICMFSIIVLTSREESNGRSTFGTPSPPPPAGQLKCPAPHAQSHQRGETRTFPLDITWCFPMRGVIALEKRRVGQGHGPSESKQTVVGHCQNMKAVVTGSVAIGDTGFTQEMMFETVLSTLKS